MKPGLKTRMDRLFNRHGDGRAICVAADHGYMSDVTPNVVQLQLDHESCHRRRGGWHFAGPWPGIAAGASLPGARGPALILRADWMNMPRLGTSNVANAVPQRLLLHQKVITAEQSLVPGGDGDHDLFLPGIQRPSRGWPVSITAPVSSMSAVKAGLPCIIEPLAYGGQVTGANIVEILTLGARMAVEIGADALKIPYTGDVESFRHLIEVSGVPTLVLGGARSDYERDALELYAEAQEAGASGCLMGRNVTKSPDPKAMIEQLTGIAHRGWTVDEALRGEVWDYVRLKAKPALCTGCNLCVVACVASHDSGEYGTNQARLRIDPGRKPGQHKVMFCTSCQKCIDVCPTEALRWHPENGAVELLPERCDNCAECVAICPTKVIIHSEEGINFDDGQSLDWYPVVCDLCGGAPECARICPTDAIFIVERSIFQPVTD